MKQDRQLSDYAIYRLQKRLQAREQDRKRKKQDRKERLNTILWVLGDALAFIVFGVAVVTLAMLDSASFVPAYIFGASVFYLAIYGAFRGVLG